MKFSITASALVFLSLNAFATDEELLLKVVVTKENIQEVICDVMEEGYNRAWNQSTLGRQLRLLGSKYLNIKMLGHNLTENERDWTFRGCFKKTNIFILNEAFKILGNDYEDYDSIMDFHCPPKLKTSILILKGEAKGKEKEFRTEFQKSFGEYIINAPCSLSHRKKGNMKKKD